MKALVALILLVQLPIHKAIPAPPPAPLGCDDPVSEAAAEVAVNYINGHSHHGYKFALNRIKDIRVIPQVSEELAGRTPCSPGDAWKSPVQGPARAVILTWGNQHGSVDLNGARTPGSSGESRSLECISQRAEQSRREKCSGVFVQC